jgi:predicted metal-dependent hydrolase
MAFAIDFARRNRPWIEQQLRKRIAEAAKSRAWTNGTQILFRGELLTIKTQSKDEATMVQFGEHMIHVPAQTLDLRPNLESYLWSLAEKELRPRTLQLAAQHELSVRRVVIRSQRSRWGSCSVKRTISLNWRLIQAPAFVCDYLILHELMHLREMNHSPRFWRLVHAACADYARAEAWLDQHSHLLR